MPRQIVTTSQAPQPVGPYSQAVRVGDLVFVSAQLPFDPLTNTLVHGGIRTQTRRVLENVRAVVEAAGGKMSQVVRTTLCVKSIDDFAQINEVYAEFFPGDKPARITFEARRLPKDAILSIDAIVHLGQ